jgi:hypothetical protein
MSRQDQRPSINNEIYEVDIQQMDNRISSMAASTIRAAVHTAVAMVEAIGGSFPLKPSLRKVHCGFQQPKNGDAKFA